MIFPSLKKILNEVQTQKNWKDFVRAMGIPDKLASQEGQDVDFVDVVGKLEKFVNMHGRKNTFSFKDWGDVDTWLSYVLSSPSSKSQMRDPLRYLAPVKSFLDSYSDLLRKTNSRLTDRSF